MKKISIIAMLLALAALLCACTPKIVSNGDTTSDTTIPVTSPDGFEDVTAPPADDTTKKEDNDTTAADITEGDTTKGGVVSNSDEALTVARNWLGDTDPDIGYKYAFSYDGMMTDNGKEYYKIRVSWYIEEQERYSLCGYLLVDSDGNVSKYSW